jgi:hypothetical protein
MANHTPISKTVHDVNLDGQMVGQDQAEVDEDPPQVVTDPDEKVDGRTIAQWSEDLLKTLINTPDAPINGLNDPQGTVAAAINNPHREMYFITAAPPGSVRSFDVHQGQDVLAPIVVNTDSEGPTIEPSIPGFVPAQGTFADEVETVLASIKYSDVTLTIDGKQVPNQQETMTGIFSAGIAREGRISKPSGGAAIGVRRTGRPIERASRLLALGVGVAMMSLGMTAGARAQTDVLYVGDTGDNTVKQFDASNGSPLGVFTKGGALLGPRGVVFDAAGNLLVSNQNVNTSLHGSVEQYNALGNRLAPLVANSNRNAPAVPRGIILLQDFLYVADFTRDTDPNAASPAPGRLLKYTKAGAFVGAFVPPDKSLKHGAEFHPRGVVSGPDGMVYVSNFPDLKTGLGGQVLRFDPTTARFDAQPFVTSTGGDSCDCINELNRPEGLVFGPDKNLYITSFRADATDTDKVVIVGGALGASPGLYLGRIDLDAGQLQPRAFAQALLFGPGGALFVPISGGDVQFTGSVRRYDLSSKVAPPTFTEFVPANGADASGPLIAPWYLTFGKTDPGTLAYQGPSTGPDRQLCICGDGAQLNICATLDCFSSPAQDAICGPACAAHGGESATGCIFNDPSCPQ